MTELTFQEEFIIYWYHGQCLYWYFTNNYKDSIDLLWSYKTDCLLDMEMLETSHGIKKYPKHGDTFSSYALINDTTIKVTYHFPEWTKKVNQIAKDSIFPNYFKRLRD